MHGSAVFLVALVTSIAGSVGTVYVVERYGLLPSREKPPEAAVVPALNGLTEGDARANAQRAHLAMLVASSEPNAEAKPGTVIRQSIAPGQAVARDTSVNVVLALELPKVPGVTGLTLAEATKKIEERGYALQNAGAVPNATVAVGLVVDQSPQADMAQSKGSAVIVHLSAGPGEFDMPKVVGVGVNQAKTDLEKLGVKPVVRWVALAETPTYVVLNQKPAPGDKVKPGAEVMLTACR